MMLDSERERKEIIRVFDVIAEEFCHSRRRIWKSLEDIGSFEGKVVLDLGAGTGRNVRCLVEKGAALVVAADVSSEMIKVLISNMKEDFRGAVHPIRCDALHLPLQASTFDKVIFVATIHHIPNRISRLRAMEEVKRVLKDGGTVLVTAWSLIQTRFLRSLPGMVAGWFGGREFGDTYVSWGRERRFYHLFRPRELRSLVERAGFLVEKAYGERVSSRLLAENWVVLARKV